MKKLPTIGTLWIGGEPSWLEQLCIQSFLGNRHEVELCSFDKAINVPSDELLADAANVLSTEKLNQHARSGAPAYHADEFRLHKPRDTDYVCAGTGTDAFCGKNMRYIRRFRLPSSWSGLVKEILWQFNPFCLR